MDNFSLEWSLDLSNRGEFKGGYLDFSHLTEWRKVYITEIYMKNQYKSSRKKYHKITERFFFDGVPLKGYIAY